MSFTHDLLDIARDMVRDAEMAAYFASFDDHGTDDHGTDEYAALLEDLANDPDAPMSEDEWDAYLRERDFGYAAQAEEDHYDRVEGWREERALWG